MKFHKTWACIVLVFCALVAPGASYAAAIGAGRWEIIANGFRMQLNITSIDAQGNLAGTLVEGTRTDQIQGFWDEAARKITFVRVINTPSTIQIYTGYLFDAGSTFCQTGEFNHMLAGSFEAFASTGGSAQRSIFGWAARQCVA